jgi:Sulfotransferase family
MTPRTACTAVGELLCRHYGGQFIPAEDILDSRGLISVQKKHSTLSQLVGHGLLSQRDADCLFKFAAVRNPFDSLASLYFKQKIKYQALLDDPSSWVNRSVGYAAQMRYARTHSFNRWIFKVCYRKLIKRALGLPISMFAQYTRGVNEILRYESITADLQAAFDKAGVPWKAEIPAVNRTIERPDPDYRLLYSRTAALAVSIVYARDLVEYNYTF